MSNEEDLLIAENIEPYESTDTFLEQKRAKLKQLVIKKLTWGVEEIYIRFTSKKLVLQPLYQRSVVWDSTKQTQFIESLIIDIKTPPIYLAEVKGKLDVGETVYEVVDGQQRLTSILRFLGKLPELGELKLESKGLEYYSDLISNMSYADAKECEACEDLIRVFLSNPIDVYIIGQSTPFDIKYDIFARLNRGSVALTEAELRRAIYFSSLTVRVDEILKEQRENNNDYERAFSRNDIKRYKDYNRIFKSFVYFTKFDHDSCTLTSYNSRPRDLINSTMQDYQKGLSSQNIDKIELIINRTIELKLALQLLAKTEKDEGYPIHSVEYFLDSLIPFIEIYPKDIIDSSLIRINRNQHFRDTFNKSSTTTAFVNQRFSIVRLLLDEIKNEQN